MAKWQEYPEKNQNMEQEDELLINSGGFIKRIKAKFFKGDTGVSISDIDLQKEGKRNDLTINLDNGVSKTFSFSDGDDGNGILDIQTSRIPNFNFTIVNIIFTSGESFSFNIPDGKDGLGTGDMLKSDNLHGLTNLKEARKNLQTYSRKEIDTKIRNIDLSSKVDVEEGKGLSSNDFTNEEKQKLAILENFSKDFNDLTNKPVSFLTEYERKKNKISEYMNFMTVKFSENTNNLRQKIVEDIGNLDGNILGVDFFKHFSFLNVFTYTRLELENIKKIIQYDTEKRLYFTVSYFLDNNFNNIKNANSSYYTQELKDFIFSEEFLDYILDSPKNNGREITDYNRYFIFKLLNENNYPQNLKNKIYVSDLFYSTGALTTNNKDGYILSNFDYEQNPNYNYSRVLNNNVPYNSLINLEKIFEKINVNRQDTSLTTYVFKFVYGFLNDNSKTLEYKIQILKKWIGFSWFKIYDSWYSSRNENINIVIHHFYYSNLENISLEEVEAMYNLLKNSSKNPYHSHYNDYYYNNFSGFENSWRKLIHSKYSIAQQIENILWNGNNYNSSGGLTLKDKFLTLNTEEKKGVISENISNVKFVNWLTRFTEVKNFLMTENEFFQSIKSQLYSTIKNNLKYFDSYTDSQDSVSSVNKGSDKTFVFAHLGSWSQSSSQGVTLTHSNGVVAGTRYGQSRTGDVSGANGVVTFNGFSVVEHSDGFINTEYYKSKDYF